MATRAAGLSLRVAPVSDDVQEDVENLASLRSADPPRRDDDAGTIASTKRGDMVERVTLRSLAFQAVAFFGSHWEKFAVLATVVFVGIAITLKGLQYVQDVLDWFQQLNNAAGLLCYTAVYCANVSLFLPGLVFMLGAGFIFKFWRGMLAVWLGGSLGQAFAFLLGRYMLRDCIVTLARGKSKRWEVIDKAIELDGWKLVLLLRLSPLVPYNLLNISMAMTRINFWQFSFVSAAAIIPECALLVYCGTLAKNVRDVVNGTAGSGGSMAWVLGGLSVVTCVGAAAWATVVARRAIKRAEAHISITRSAEESGSAETPARRLNPALSAIAQQIISKPTKNKD